MAAFQKTSITSLPTELLEQIFLIAASFEPSYPSRYSSTLLHAQRCLTLQGTPRDPATLLALQRVCKRWREIAVSFSDLWAYLSLRTHSVAWKNRVLRLSGCAPLTVRATYPTQGAYLLELLHSEAHRISSLDVDHGTQLAVENNRSVTLHTDFPQLKEIKLERPCEARFPWLSLLARAPNLTHLEFAGMWSSYLHELASTLPFRGLKTLALQGTECSRVTVDASALLALLHRLPNIENLYLKAIDLTGEERIRPGTKEISLRHLRDVQVMWCDSLIYRVLRCIALPRGTRIELRLSFPNPQHSETLLDFMTRIGFVLHDTGTLRSLQISLDHVKIELLGYRSASPEDQEWPDLRVEFCKIDPYYGDDESDAASLLKLVPRACARLPLTSIHTLTLGAHEDRWGPQALFTGLRPILAGLAHVQELRVEGLVSRLTVESIVELLTKRRDGRAPLPSLTTLLFDAADVCRNYNDAFFDELRALLLARWQLDAPIQRLVVRSEEEEVFTDAQKMIMRTSRTAGMEDSCRLVRHFATGNTPARTNHLLPELLQTATRTKWELCDCKKTTTYRDMQAHVTIINA